VADGLLQVIRARRERLPHLVLGFLQLLRFIVLLIVVLIVSRNTSFKDSAVEIQQTYIIY
jgi:hypothetical protein